MAVHESVAENLVIVLERDLKEKKKRDESELPQILCPTLWLVHSQSQQVVLHMRRQVTETSVPIMERSSSPFALVRRIISRAATYALPPESKKISVSGKLVATLILH